MPKKSSTLDDAYIQKWAFEIRFIPRPSMAVLGGQLADAWVQDFPEIELQFPNYRLINRSQYRSMVFTPTNVVIDIEGEADFTEAIKLMQRFAEQYSRIGQPTSLLRLGLRYTLLVPGPDQKTILSHVANQFFAAGNSLIEATGRDQISDIGIVLDYNNEDRQGRIVFGPYLREANLPIFAFQTHPKIAELNTGFIYDCDTGIVNPPVDILNQKNFLQWIHEAYSMSRDRVRQVHKLIGLDAETEK